MIIIFFSGFKHIFWSIIVCVAMGCAAIFLYSNTIDFMNATVVTTVDTMTVPLSEVFFPSVVVCNINQVCEFRVQIPFSHRSGRGNLLFFPHH